MYVTGALKNMDNSLNEAAESLGCVGIRKIFQIVIPLILPTMLASGLLVFMQVAGRIRNTDADWRRLSYTAGFNL